MDSWSNGSFSEGQGFWINWLETLKTQLICAILSPLPSGESYADSGPWFEMMGLGQNYVNSGRSLEMIGLGESYVDYSVACIDGSRREQCGLWTHLYLSWDNVGTLNDSVFLITQTTHHSMFIVISLFLCECSSVSSITSMMCFVGLCST